MICRRGRRQVLDDSVLGNIKGLEGGKVSRPEKMLKPFKFGTGVLLKAGANLAVRAAKSEPAYPGLRELISRLYQAVETSGTPPISKKEILLAAELVDMISQAPRN